MPSANPKLDKQTSHNEATEPIRQAIIVIEHRIRNLEKRKGKLESYKNIQRNGGELNSDQKTAVEKFDEVQQSLEITREMYKQIVSIANDSAKQQKKLARKEALERMQQDILKVKEVIMVQNTLANLLDTAVRGDFLGGLHGAIKLTEEELSFLDRISSELMIKQQIQEHNICHQAQKIAEHFVAIVDGKQREVVGTTYSKIREIINNVIQSGYFTQTSVQSENEMTEVKDAIQEICVNNIDALETTNNKYINESHIPPSETLLPMPNFSAQGLTHESAPEGSISVTVSAAAQSSLSSISLPTESPYFPNTHGFTQSQDQQEQSLENDVPSTAPRINEVIGTTNFFFLQESELDTPESTSQAQSTISHISVAANPPIPTQTFTNQSFTTAPVPASQAIFQHQQQHDMSHITGFGNSNPPPPIPMPPSHQNNLQFSPPQHPSFQQQQTQNQTFEQMIHQEGIINAEKKIENLHEDCHVVREGDESNDWGQATDTRPGDWSQSDQSHQDLQDSQFHNPQQVWGESRNFRSRGGRRGSSNGYAGRSRGYQQNGRGSTSYYRNDGNYQNGYQRNWSGGNEPSTTFTAAGFKRGNSSRTLSRSDRGSRGQFRGNQRGAIVRGNYMNRNKV